MSASSFNSTLHSQYSNIISGISKNMVGVFVSERRQVGLTYRKILKYVAVVVRV